MSGALNDTFQTSLVGSREATPDPICSSDGSEFKFDKKKANNSSVAETQLEHKKAKPGVPDADIVESSDGISGMPPQK